jgi:predicted RNA-binding protein associated with RNAse of E/G family
MNLLELRRALRELEVMPIEEVESLEGEDLLDAALAYELITRSQWDEACGMRAGI